MTQVNKEASPIARLIKSDDKRTIGWVYAWATSELSILWVDEQSTVAFSDSEIHFEMQATATATTPENVVAFLSRLRETTSESGL